MRAAATLLECGSLLPLSNSGAVPKAAASCRTPYTSATALAAGLLTVVNLACGQPWNLCTPPVQPYNQWQTVAGSADGSTLVAAGYTFEPYAAGPGPAPIYVSTNYGITWTTNGAPSEVWQAVACSADGAVLVAVAQDIPFYDGSELIYTSTNSGVTWSSSAPTNTLGWSGNTWSSVAASADGTRLVATAALVASPPGGAIFYQGDGLIYISTNSGAAWLRSAAPTNEWISVATSADGSKVVAAALPGTYSGPWGSASSDGFIYLSSDAGATWTRTSANSNDWASVASSADGTVLLAGSTTAGDGLIYASRDSGGSWSPTAARNDNWAAVAMSADGTSWMAAGVGSGSIYTSTDFGTTWTPTDAPGASWTALASSADGYKVVAASVDGWLCTLPYSGPWRFADAPVYGAGLVASSADGTNLVLAAANQIFISSDAGNTWTPTGPSDQWVSLASSADGSKLFAAATADCYGGDGLIYTSNDSGATWTPTSAPSNQWHSVACSADGNNLIAATIYDASAGNSLIYSSSDAGGTWKPTSASTGGGVVTNGAFAAVALSADGTKEVATISGWFSCLTFGAGSIYRSTNSASSWTRTGAPRNQWSCVASSADGSKLVAGAYGYWNAYGDGSLYTSVDSGAIWKPTRAPENNWTSVASSADGARLVAVAASAYEYLSAVYISTNSGTSWTPAGTPAWTWNAVASSANGSNIVVVGDGFICTLQSPSPAPPTPPSPQLSIGLTATKLSLSWLVPSTPFVLQQNSDLRSTNWVDVPTNLTLNLTNLHYEVTLSASLGARFYRLRQQ